MTSHAAIFITSSVRCNAHFSCSKHCDFGYRSGDNSCPTCQCLIPIKGRIFRNSFKLYINIVFNCRSIYSSTGNSAWWIFNLNFPRSYNSTATCRLLYSCMNHKNFLDIGVYIKQFMIQSYLVSTSQHGCSGVGCHQTISTSGAVGHVISTHQSGSQAVPLKILHRPVSPVQITHVSGSHGTISWWRSIIRHWFNWNLHKLLFILH